MFLRRTEMREKCVGLELHRHFATRRRQRGHILAASVPRRYGLEPGNPEEVVDLPQPDGPSSAASCPALTVKLT